MPSDRSRRPTDARRSGSSSMTNTVEVASDIAATRKRSRKSACIFGLAGPADRAFLIPILEPEQPLFLKDARREHQSLCALTQLAPLRRSGRFSAEVRSLVGPI